MLPSDDRAYRRRAVRASYDCKDDQKETRAEREETAFPVYVQTGSTSMVRAHQPKERDGSGTQVET
jgi:hypothetical protein